MRTTFDQAWNNAQNLWICGRTASITYRGETISTTFNPGDFDTLRRYPKEEGAPATRAERTEYRNAYKWICEQIINEQDGKE